MRPRSFRTAAAFRKWLERHHSTATELVVRVFKAQAAARGMTNAQAVDEALCFGWIDGQARGHDEHFYLQRFTPRRRRSKWSQINVEKAERLIAAGRMHPSGLAQVEAAKADGRWEAAYPAQSQARVPEDFQRALDARPAANEFFATLSGGARYAFLYRLHNVSRPDARAKRIATYIERLSEGRTLDG